jgi:hypothetical protein
MIAPNPDGENTRGIPESYREEGVPQHSGAFVPLEPLSFCGTTHPRGDDPSTQAWRNRDA